VAKTPPDKLLPFDCSGFSSRVDDLSIPATVSASVVMFEFG